MLRQASQAVSKLKHPDKYKLVQMCIEKEKEGFECTVPIHYVDEYHKNFNHDKYGYYYKNTSTEGYWQAIYRKKFEVRT